MVRLPPNRPAGKKRSGRLLRLRRTAHKHHRRGTCGSPCPQSLSSFAGSTPSGGYRPPLRRLPPKNLQQSWCFVASHKKSFSSGPEGSKSSEEWRTIRLRIGRRYRNRPRGAECLTKPPYLPSERFLRRGDGRAASRPSRSP